jgi:hypothetical protein
MQPKQIVFTARYGLYLDMYFRLIFTFKWLRFSLEFILPYAILGKGCFEIGVGISVSPKRVDLRIILKWIVNEWNESVWVEFIWFAIGASSRLDFTW